MSDINLREIPTPVIDGENNTVIFDHAYSVKGDQLDPTISKIKQLHGSEIGLLPLSAVSAGGGVFQVAPSANNKIIGISIPPATKPQISHKEEADIAKLSLDQIIIDRKNWQVLAGAAITLQQLNDALSDELGSHFKVLGADLTSYTYAQVGSTFMTGGMGPQRRYFSNSVNQIALHDGDDIKVIERHKLSGYAGTFGWTGMVAAVRCQFHQLPNSEIAFAIPVNNSAQSIAQLLSHLSAHCFLDCSENCVSTEKGESNLILGLEHVTVSSMQPMFATGNENEITLRGKHLAEKCKQANADGLIFVNGFSNLEVDDFLIELLDQSDDENPTIAGINLEHTEIFNDPDMMRSLREAIPFAARTQEPKGAYSFKNHTDVNIQLHPENVLHTAQAFWEINMDYVHAIEKHFSTTNGLSAEIIIYGHLNPTGLDPHNRITLATDCKETYDHAVDFILQNRAEYFRQLKALCDEYDATFVGGEKSAGSECKMFAAFGELQNSPRALREKFKIQKATIAAASPLFSWRALPPYQ